MTRQRIILAVAGAALIAAGGVAALLTTGVGSRHYQPRSLPRVAPSVTSPAPGASQTAAPAISRSQPVKLIIPSIGVDASVMNLGLCPTSQWGDYCAGIPKNGLATPPLTGPLAQDAGWWSGGAAPGQDGPAVIAGHVNSRAEGNLVFASLGKLRRGDPVEVQLADGVQVTFTVTATEEVAKNAFPTQDVYGATSDPELRLITCGGVFDPSTGHYDSNLIVFAAEVAS